MQALFVNRLTTLDFSYLCAQRGVVGETWIADITLWGALDEQGMVFDFGHVKKQVKSLLDELADHRLLVPATAEASSVFNKDGRTTVHFSAAVGSIVCKAPEQAVLVVEAEAITPECLEPLLAEKVLQALPDNVERVTLQLRPEEVGGAYYHYSHGLKKHEGDCQRIAHGHRSKIQVFVDDQRDQALEAWWANQWRDVYIATREDLLETVNEQGVEYHHFGYEARQGRFELSLPASCCCMIETDSTVELLARYIAQQMAKTRPGKNIKVFAYEGLDKGAVASG